MTDRGPKPASALPWLRVEPFTGCDGFTITAGIAVDDEGGVGDWVANPDEDEDALAIVHRVNNWDALHDRLTAETARADEAEAELDTWKRKAEQAMAIARHLLPFARLAAQKHVWASDAATIASWDQPSEPRCETCVIDAATGGPGLCSTCERKAES